MAQDSMPDPSRFKRVRVEMARTPAFPDGSAAHGYDIIAPMSDDGYLDPQVWKAHPELCSVRRFWQGEPDRFGLLEHRAGGMGGATWIIDYEEDRSDDDEAGYRFDYKRFVPGEYVTIRDMHGAHTFRVAHVAGVSPSDLTGPPLRGTAPMPRKRL